MARITKPLTVSEIRKAKPKDKLYKLYDGLGLYLAVSPTGKKVWRFDYTDNNKKRQTHTIGDLDFISLEEARLERLKLREKLFRGGSLKTDNGVTFSHIYEKWFANWSAKRAKTTTERAKYIIDTYFIPKIGNIAIEKITTRDIAQALHEIDKTGAREMLNKAKSAVRLCFAYSISSGYRDNNPVTDINNSIFSEQVKNNNRHLKKSQIYQIHTILKDSKESVSALCFEYMVRNLSRPSEAAALSWGEFNKETGIVSIKSERMKMRRPHLIPLSEQSLEIIQYAKENFLSDNFIFPNRTARSHITTTTMSSLLNKNEIDSSLHGFRHLASTILHESRLFPSEIIERAMSHADSNAIRATYNHAQYIEEIRPMLQWWSDFIDKCDTKDNNERALKEAGISLI